MYISDKCYWVSYGTNPRLDEVVDDDDWRIRINAANTGYGLDKLINDKDYHVRAEVARRGYGLDILVNDAVDDVRIEVAHKGYGLDILINDNRAWVRKEVAKQGYGLDILVNDEDWSVREAVAQKGYGLDKIINDADSSVRAAVADQGYGLDKLINDKSSYVREAVARQCYGLDILVNDEDPDVRKEVAKHGYGLDKLINDEDYTVQDSVRTYLREYNLKIGQWLEQYPDKCVLDPIILLEESIKDFIYKINDSNKLKAQSYYDSIDEFFNSKIEDNIKMNTIIIYAIDTKIPLFKVEKLKSDNQINYKFIIDIMTDKGEHFNVESFIQSQTQLTKFIQQIADTLNLYSQFSKYADDLESCL